MLLTEPFPKPLSQQAINIPWVPTISTDKRGYNYMRDVKRNQIESLSSWDLVKQESWPCFSPLPSSSTSKNESCSVMFNYVTPWTVAHQTHLSMVSTSKHHHNSIHYMSSILHIPKDKVPFSLSRLGYFINFLPRLHLFVSFISLRSE